MLERLAVANLLDVRVTDDVLISVGRGRLSV
jgi:hypothetical protein